MANISLACSMNPFELFWHRDTLLPGIIARSEVSEPLTEGIRWGFRPTGGLMLALATMIDSERRCCPFLRFQVVAEPNNGFVWLEVTGPPGTRDFLERLPRH